MSLRERRDVVMTGASALLFAAVSFVPPSAFTGGSEAVATDIASPLRIVRRGPMPPAWKASSSTDSQCWNTKPSEKAFAEKMNAARERAGRGKLKLDPELSKVGRKHTREMIDRALLHHTSSDALANRVTHWSVLGENVGVGGDVDSLHIAFMDSPAHKANILYSSFRYFGVGVFRDDSRMWVTVIFETRDNPGTTLRMPRC